MNIEVKEKIKEEEENLVIVDLDGTILDEDFSTLNQRNKTVLKKIKKLGHEVCIATGRNYLSALPIYNELELDSFLITYNGAYINNPSLNEKEKLKKNKICWPISNLVVESILEEKLIKENLINVLVDTEDLVTISTSDDIYYQQVFFNDKYYIKTKESNIEEIKKELKKRDCLQLVLEFENKLEKVEKIFSLLNQKYHTSITFYCSDKLKAGNKKKEILIKDEEKVIIKIRNSKADKGIAVEWVSVYNNIPMERRIAFGNDVNDLELMKKVGKGVAMSGSILHLKSRTRGGITDFGKFSEGVAKYLEEYFKI